LRERRDDIPLLVDSLLRRGGNVLRRLTVTPQALEQLQAHTWPGNIRELRNVLERARLFADEGVIGVEHLPPALGPATTVRPEPVAPPDRGSRVRRSWSDDELREQLRLHPGTRRDLAEALGLSERTLYRRLRSIMDDPAGADGTARAGV
jgi:DNA-binding NtrC family response regulator